MDRLLSHAPFLPKGQSSWLLPPVGQARRSVFHLHLGHRLLGVSLPAVGSSLDRVSFHLSGQQALVEITYLLWGAKCDWVLLIFIGDQTLQCLRILRLEKHMVPTTTLDG